MGYRSRRLLRNPTLWFLQALACWRTLEIVLLGIKIMVTGTQERSETRDNNIVYKCQQCLRLFHTLHHSMSYGGIKGRWAPTTTIIMMWWDIRYILPKMMPSSTLTMPGKYWIQWWSCKSATKRSELRVFGYSVDAYNCMADMDYSHFGDMSKANQAYEFALTCARRIWSCQLVDHQEKLPPDVLEPVLRTYGWGWVAYERGDMSRAIKCSASCWRKNHLTKTEFAIGSSWHYWTRESTPKRKRLQSNFPVDAKAMSAIFVMGLSWLIFSKWNWVLFLPKRSKSD